MLCGASKNFTTYRKKCTYWVHVVSCLVSHEVVSGRCAVGKCVQKIHMILLLHWIIAYCKTTKCIGTLNFTNMNLAFVVINPFIVCLSIEGHLTQGNTGCHKRVCLLLVDHIQVCMLEMP